jgi:uncharacterized protein YegJ (DUF2314 family)
VASTTFYASSHDLAEARDGARATFKYFWRELSWEGRRIVPGFDLVAVKLEFEDAGLIEYMWVGDVEFDGEWVSGTLINSPNELTNVKAGDAVRTRLSERFWDWMLTGSDRVLGAFTIQAMRIAMSEEDRSEHDAAWQLEFGDPAKVALPPSDDDHPMALNMAASLEAYLDENPGAVRESNDAGFTMLHREALAGNANIVRVLLARGADHAARTRGEKTPLALARALGWPAVEAALVAAGARE